MNNKKFQLTKGKIEISAAQRWGRSALWVIVMSLLFSALFTAEFVAPMMSVYSIVVSAVLIIAVSWAVDFWGKKSPLPDVILPAALTIVCAAAAVTFRKLFASGAIYYVNGIISNWNRKMGNINPIYLAPSDLEVLCKVLFAGLISIVLAAWTCFAIRKKWHMALLIFNFLIFAAYSLVSVSIPVWAVVWMAFDMVIYAVTVDSDVELLSKQKSYYVILALGTIIIAGSIILAGRLIPKERMQIMQHRFVGAVERMIYGESDLTDGNLTNVTDKNISSDIRLGISSAFNEKIQEKNLYLRGFVGASYDGYSWGNLDKQAYSESDKEMLQWMQEHGYWPQFLLQKSLELTSGGISSTEGAYTVSNEGASNKYLYAPYGMYPNQTVDGLLVNNGFYSSFEDEMYGNANRDQNLENDAINQKHSYTFAVREAENSTYEVLRDTDNSLKRGDDDYSGLSEMEDFFDNVDMSDQDAVAAAESAMEKKMMEEMAAIEMATFNGDFFTSEMAYRNYVDKYYMDVPENIRAFLDEELSSVNLEDSGAYTVLSLVRSYLESNIRYSVTPEQSGRMEDGSFDFVLDFLQNKKEGYSVHYASAGVLMFRYLGIPARYVEGYFAHITNDATSVITARDAHAWVEIYRYGFGWVPVEVTEGFYTHPDDIKKIPRPEFDEQEEPEDDGNEEEILSPEDNAGDAADEEPPRPSYSYILIIVLVLAAIVGAILIRRALILRNRKKRINDEERLAGIKCAVKHIVKIAGETGIHLDESWLSRGAVPMNKVFEGSCGKDFTEVSSAVSHAHYSREGADENDLKVSVDYMEKAAEHVYKSSKWYRRIRLKYITVLL